MTNINSIVDFSNHPIDDLNYINKCNSYIKENSILIDINGNTIDAVDQILQMDPENVKWITYINPNGEKVRLRF